MLKGLIIMENKDIMQEVTVSGKFLEYKGRPLVREDNTICYGFMEDPYILQMTIMTTKQQNNKEVPDKILIQIVKTDKSFFIIIFPSINRRL